MNRREDLSSSPDAGARFAERRESARYPFFAGVEIFEPISKVRLQGRITEISLKGCYIEVPEPMRTSTIIQMSIVQERAPTAPTSETASGLENAAYELWGRVVFAREAGMGVAFMKMLPENEAAIRRWISGSP